MSFEIGDVVRVTYKKERFNGKFGKIVKIDNGNVDGPWGVQFPKCYNHLFDYPLSSDTVVFFNGKDLQRVILRYSTKDHSLLQTLMALFGRDVGICVYNMPDNFALGFSKCTHKECDKIAVGRTMIFWTPQRAVYEVDVCPEHAHFHGHQFIDEPPPFIRGFKAGIDPRISLDDIFDQIIEMPVFYSVEEQLQQMSTALGNLAKEITKTE